MTRCYLDNAATSYPKPESVADAVCSYLRDNGAPAGRSAYRQAMAAGRIVESCRQSAARMFGVPASRQLVFTCNGTDSLNLALLGYCRPGDHVVTTTWEHNSVLRPLKFLAEQRQVDVTLLEPDTRGLIDPAQVQDHLRDETRLVAIQHANNVVGVVQPIAEIGQLVKVHGAAFLVDAAQSAGHLPIDVTAMSIDLLAASGHKGLLGPLGTGVLAVSERVAAELIPLRFGGTGTRSEDNRQPSELPEKYESGNHNVPGLVGLAAALEWLAGQPSEQLLAQEQRQTRILWDGLCKHSGIRLLGPSPADVERVAVISLQLDSLSPEDAAAILDEHFEIECRAGLHCAPGVHRSLGTFESGGTLRLSPGRFTTDAEIEHAIAAVVAIAGG